MLFHPDSRNACEPTILLRIQIVLTQLLIADSDSRVLATEFRCSAPLGVHFMSPSPNASHDRPLADATDQRSKTLAQATYYRRRAEDHRLIALRAVPAARVIHEQFMAAYLAAAIAAEQGKAAELGGDHRAEGHGTLAAHSARLAVAAE